MGIIYVRTSTDTLDGYGLGPLCTGWRYLLGGIESGVEECVDEGGLAEARFTCGRRHGMKDASMSDRTTTISKRGDADD